MIIDVMFFEFHTEMDDGFVNNFDIIVNNVDVSDISLENQDEIPGFVKIHSLKHLV